MWTERCWTRRRPSSAWTTTPRWTGGGWWRRSSLSTAPGRTCCPSTRGWWPHSSPACRTWPPSWGPCSSRTSGPFITIFFWRRVRYRTVLLKNLFYINQVISYFPAHLPVLHRHGFVKALWRIIPPRFEPVLRIRNCVILSAYGFYPVWNSYIFTSTEITSHGHCARSYSK